MRARSPDIGPCRARDKSRNAPAARRLGRGRRMAHRAVQGASAGGALRGIAGFRGIAAWSRRPERTNGRPSGIGFPPLSPPPTRGRRRHARRAPLRKSRGGCRAGPAAAEDRPAAPPPPPSAAAPSRPAPCSTSRRAVGRSIPSARSSAGKRPLRATRESSAGRRPISGQPHFRPAARARRDVAPSTSAAARMSRPPAPVLLPTLMGSCAAGRARQPSSSAGSTGTRSASASRLVSAAMATTASSSPCMASVMPLARAAAVWLAMQ